MNKILIFTYSTAQGGSELNALKIIKLCKNIKFDWVELFSSKSDLKGKIKDCKNVQNFITLGFSGFKTFEIINSLRILYSIFRNENYQTVYAVGFIPALLTSFLKPFFYFRFISTRRERLPWAKFYHVPFIYFINFMSDYIETNSKTIKYELQKSIFTKQKVYFLPNIILKVNNSRNKIFKKQNKYIGNVANVRDAKNIDLFLSIALEIIKQKKNIVFILVGKDSSDRKVKNFIYKNKLKDRLIIIEDINYDQIFSIYLGLDMFLFTSKYEGSPNVLFEAMSEFIPVISSKIFATEELIHNGVNGYLCDLNDQNEFIEKINLLLSNKTKYNFIKSNLKKSFEKENSLDTAVKIINNKLIWNVEGKLFNE